MRHGMARKGSPRRMGFPLEEMESSQDTISLNNNVEETVGEHATLFEEHSYVKPSGNCDLSRMSDPHNEFKGKNVLIERNSTDAMASKFGMPVEKYVDILGTCRRKLFDVRSTRPRSHLDDKVIVSWNGLAISAFTRASKILKGEPEGNKFNFPVVWL